MNPKQLHPFAARIKHFAFDQIRVGRIVQVVRCTNEPAYLIASKVTTDWAQVNCPRCLAKGQPEEKVAA